MSLLGYATVHGTAATFRRVGLGDYVPKTGTATDTETDTSINMVLQNLEADEVGQGDIDVDDRKYIMPASEITGGDPTTEDQVLIGSVVYEIVSVMPVEKHGVDDFYLLQLRRIK